MARLPHEKNTRLSVVIPCHNESECLDHLYRRVVDVCGELVGDDFEILLIDDGSSDETWHLIEQYAKSDSRIMGVSLSRNYGHQIALSAGLELVSGDRVFVIDADLQDPPELLGEMMKKMDEGYDVVYGSRVVRAGESHFKKVTAKLFYRLLGRLSDIKIPNDTGDFRLMTRRVVDVLVTMPEQHRYIRGMVSWIGFQQTSVRYERDARIAGETSYPFRKMVALAINAITSFSVVPLRIASHLALLFAVIGLAVLAYVVAAFFLGRTVEGWTSLAALVLILGSSQLMMLGIFGEYLGRMYMESKRRPMYLIDRICKSELHESATTVDCQSSERGAIHE